MNAYDFDLELGDWIQDGPTGAPEHSIAAALDHARAHPRRRDPLAVLRRDPMGSRGAGSGCERCRSSLCSGCCWSRRWPWHPSAACSTSGRSLSRRSRSASPSVAPTASPSTAVASPSATPVSPVVLSVDLVGFGGRDLSTIEVVDESGTLVGARTGQPAEDPSDPNPTVANDPADPATVVLTWYGLLDDTDRRLTIAPDGRTMTLDVLQGCGDLLPFNRVLALTFSGPVPADEVTVTIATEPRTCE